MIEIDNSENFYGILYFALTVVYVNRQLNPFNWWECIRSIRWNDFFRGARRSPDENRERTKLRLFIVNQLFQSARPKRCLKS